MSKLGRLAFAIAALAVIADQALKAWVHDGLRLAEGQTLPLFGPIQLTGVWNPGVSFNVLQTHQDLIHWALAAFSVGVAIALALWVRSTERAPFAVALGLVIGGAVGNAIDRTRYGAVIDFIDLSPLHFPWIFNIADSAISVGIGLLLLDMLRQDTRSGASGATGKMA